MTKKRRSSYKLVGYEKTPGPIGLSMAPSDFGHLVEIKDQQKSMRFKKNQSLKTILPLNGGERNSRLTKTDAMALKAAQKSTASLL